MGEGQENFCCGFLYGFIAAGIIASILAQMREARTKMGHKDRALDNFPDSVQPSMTSQGVVNTSRQAMFRYFIWSIALIFIVLVVAGGVLYLMG